MSEQAIKYLRENKGKYPAEELAKTLRDARYDAEDVRVSVGEVFGYQSSTPPQVSSEGQSFWNFTEKKVYTSAGKKWLDFLCGVFAPFLFSALILATQFFDPYSYHGDPLGWFFLAEFFAVIYFWNRRRFIRWGIISQILFYPIIILLFGILITPF